MHPFDTLRLCRSLVRRVRSAVPPTSTVWGSYVIKQFREHKTVKDASVQRDTARDYEFYLANVLEHKRLVDAYMIGQEKTMRERIANMSRHVGLEVPDFPVLKGLDRSKK